MYNPTWQALEELSELFRNIEHMQTSLTSATRKLAIWEAIDEPKVYPNFMNLNKNMRDTIIALAPLKPVYFGSTVLKLYGLIWDEPADLDILFNSQEELEAFSKSKLVHRKGQTNENYFGHLTPYAHSYKPTGIKLDLVVDEYSDVVYSHNMCYIPIQQVIAQVLDRAQKNFNLHSKHYRRINEVVRTLDGK